MSAFYQLWTYNKVNDRFFHYGARILPASLCASLRRGARPLVRRTQRAQIATKTSRRHKWQPLFTATTLVSAMASWAPRFPPLALRGKGENLPSLSVLAAASAPLPEFTVFITTVATACTAPASVAWVFTGLPRITPSRASRASILARAPELKGTACPAPVFSATARAARV